MALMRKACDIAGLSVPGLLAVLCVIGAFLGAARAAVMFNSPVLITLWACVAVLLAARIVRRGGAGQGIGVRVACLGGLLLLAGGFAGSRAGQRLWCGLTGHDAPLTGQLPLRRGEAADTVLDDDFSHIVGRLPFQVRLEGFAAEYYEPPGAPWSLFLLVAGPDGVCAEPVDWKQGRRTRLLGAAVTVEDYLPGARPVFDEDEEPALIVRAPGDRFWMVPARVGETVSVEDAGVVLTVAEVIPSAVGFTGAAAESTLKVSVSEEGRQDVLVFVGAGTTAEIGRNVRVEYTLPAPVGAVVQPGSGLPAARVVLAVAGREVSCWLIARGPDAPVVVYPEDGGGLGLALAPPRRNVRNYASTVSVVKGGRTAADAVLRVNAPLRVGGYRLYQQPEGSAGDGYTVLLVRPDSGWGLVLVGMLCGLLGVTFACWVGPLLRCRRGEGGGHGA